LRHILVNHLGVYELVEVRATDDQGGEIFVATTDHQEIASNFVLGFLNDCFPNEKSPDECARETVTRHIQNGSLFLWKNSKGDTVSMAAKNRESRNAAAISLVYTPKELRGQGYESRIVARLTQKLLDEGKSKCNLFTDLKNPTSNSSYQKIGYRFLGESIHFDFMS